MSRVPFVLVALAFVVAARSQPASNTMPSDTAEPSVPADLAALVLAAAPDIEITGGELNSSGNQYEVTGTLPNGDEVELDLVQSNGAWVVLEIQRDVPWSSVPQPVRATAAAAPDAFEPIRVIESTQTEDGSIVYELFRANTDGSRSRGPAMEVRWLDGNAEIIR